MLRFDATALVKEIEGKASEVLLQAGNDIFAVSQQLVPVDTGALKASGRVEQESANRVVIGYGNEETVRYARYQEYGTSVSAAQPFLTPAFAQAKETIEQRAREVMNK